MVKQIVSERRRTACYSEVMPLFVELFWCVAALELLLWLFPGLVAKRIVASLLMPLIVASTVGIFVHHLTILMTLISVASVYRVGNMARLARARRHEKFLRRSSLQTSLWLIGGQLVAIVLGQITTRLAPTAADLRWLIVYAGILSALVLLTSTVRHLRTTRFPVLDAARTADRDLPSLTVAIPARNETDDLDACLRSLLASTYPKLEILVLDDCSQNKHTPEIIRSFAHDGVRFLQGRVPDDNWLAKNFAYQQLFDASNGELLLFCGVDVRFAPNSLRLLVEALLKKHKSMFSVIPQNKFSLDRTTLAALLVQPMRYAWELSLPRRFLRRPPVLSTCWLIKRDVLASAGGFAGVSRSIVPENYFARLSAGHDGYSFIQSNSEVGIVSTKSAHEQQATTVRTRYPQVHRRIELVCALTIAEVIGILVPYVLLLYGVATRTSTPLIVLNAVTVAILTVTYMLVVRLTYRHWLLRSSVMLPLASIFDVGLMNYSMICYEFFSVVWKGRNVCIPVMHVEQQLAPKTQFVPLKH